jgi:hypothetical protein
MLPNNVHLVDVNGYDVPVGEKDLPPHDPTDAANWPAWTDNFYWEVEPDEHAALEAAEVERITDILDAPQPSPGEAIWAQLMIEGSLSSVSGGSPDAEPYQPTAEDWADYHGWSEDLDRRRPPLDQVSDDELAMMAAGLPIG